MRFLKRIFDTTESDRKRRIEEANSRFNIRTINGGDVITYLGVVVSRVGDTDLLERLQEYRKQYIEN